MIDDKEEDKGFDPPRDWWCDWSCDYQIHDITEIYFYRSLAFQ